MKKYVVLLFAALVFQRINAQVGVNADQSSPDASAMLDVKSANKGMLVPRMTNAQVNQVVSPATGLLVYQTDLAAGFYYYNGSSWGPITPAAPASSQVIYSNWNYASNLRDTAIDQSSVQVMDLAAPSLTSAMLNNATIQVFFTFGAGDFVLPYTSFAGGKVNTMSFIPQPGNILITRFTHDNSNAVPLSTLLQYRFVIIPGSTSVVNSVKPPNHPTLSNASSVPPAMH